MNNLLAWCRRHPVLAVLIGLVLLYFTPTILGAAVSLIVGLLAFLKTVAVMVVWAVLIGAAFAFGYCLVKRMSK